MRYSVSMVRLRPNTVDLPGFKSVKPAFRSIGKEADSCCTTFDSDPSTVTDAEQ